MTTAQLPAHMQIFDPVPFYLARSGPLEFTLFSQLPTELRQKIWCHFLEQPRMVKLGLWSHRLMDVIIDHEGEGSSSSANHDGPCAVVLGRRQKVLSKLLRVNSEARETVLSFYRAHLPCRMFKKEGKSKYTTAEGVVYINPEFDFVYLKSKEGNSYVPFIHYFKSVVDPRGVGILNLILNPKSLGDLYGAIPQHYDASVRKSFTNTLQSLRQVYFLDKISSRMVPNWNMMCQPAKYQVNRSCPISATGTSFQRFPRDPRAVGLDLKILLTHTFASSFVRDWREFLTSWGIAVSTATGTETQETTKTATDIRHLVACKPRPGSNDGVYDRKSAQGMLKSEMDHWTGYGFADVYSRKDNWGKYITAEASNEDLEEALAVKPAFGFWVFPTEACISAINHHQHNEWPVLDYTGYWPELFLWNLD
ncbi:hypothetical protein F5B22DRAFT_612891 [Xylaria bambusicola]|uniref:uncharacterized protein n=1 Tax=Xylaria bambusicola TaxID=326684 RepID=UPI002007AFEE|nr:uncharacterized protein F5B22DRAFT_612891 [Xylaria bambusicola]KAI0512983.1 hypothetical protein F5B22DRAFT_612891 [Xylaria bambusicola]